MKNTRHNETLDYHLCHYGDVIMTTIASQITSLTVVYSIVYSDADQRKHQISASLAHVWGTHRDRWIPRTKGQLRGKCFHLMTSSCTFSQPRVYLCFGLFTNNCSSVTWAFMRLIVPANIPFVQRLVCLSRKQKNDQSVELLTMYEGIHWSVDPHAKKPVMLQVCPCDIFIRTTASDIDGSSFTL